MARPVTAKTLDGITVTGGGEAVPSMGHPHCSIFVHDADSGSFEVHLEGSPDGTEWGVVRNGSGNDIIVDHNDLNADGNVLRHVEVATEFVRGKVVSITGATLTSWVMFVGNPGQGQRGSTRVGSP